MILALTHIGYIIGGWGATALAVGGYAFVTLRRGRRLAALVPPEERRWS